ncbi:LOW QUALITY PROTEIN: putative F-box only protein 9, partial [Eutrema salsugineum]|uniref:LOW QUALITY PROTEIN: putative F-box only protein 9 n=1 Tax=Eutrema salsugineum TaxID=72664 RepID=UPI000CED2452
MSDLPSELVEEILSRVPATILKRFRSICKRWKALFKDRRFTEKNSGKAPKQSLILLVMLTELITFSVSNSLNVADLSSIEFKVPLGLKNITHLSDSEKVREVFHCGGLLLCTITPCELVVWNPCLGETRWIQPKIDFKGWSKYSLGYENNKFCLSFK